jgi:hypothetical protein
MTFSEAEWEVLTSANEDLCGLYEAVWSMRTMFPDATEQELRKTAYDAMVSLIQKGVVELSWTTARNENITTVATEEALRLLGDESLWEPPEWEAKFLAFGATDKGQRAWRKSSPPITLPVDR